MTLSSFWRTIIQYRGPNVSMVNYFRRIVNSSTESGILWEPTKETIGSFLFGLLKPPLQYWTWITLLLYCSASKSIKTPGSIKIKQFWIHSYCPRNQRIFLWVCRKRQQVLLIILHFIPKTTRKLLNFSIFMIN